MKNLLAQQYPSLLTWTILSLLWATRWTAVLGQACDLDCKNGGECQLAPPDPVNPTGSEFCLCSTGFIGELCEESGPETNNNGESGGLPACGLVCQNEGQCYIAPPDPENPHGFSYCLCRGGFAGDFCEQNDPEGAGGVDELPQCNLQCQNGGECHIAPPDVEIPTGFAYCLCPASWFGDLCEQEDIPEDGGDAIPACDLDCKNGGECSRAPPDQQNPTGFNYCLCQAGWLGDLCEDGGPADGAETGDGGGAAVGNSGSDTGGVPTSCNLDCQNGGQCVFTQPSVEGCSCQAGYQGDRCELAETKNSCDLDCKNGGQCQMLPPDEQNINGFKYCLCPAGLLGDLCERGEPEPTCSLQCQNGGTCELGMAGSEDPDGFQYCLCPAGMHGTLCDEEETQPCGQAFCHHGGKCMVGDDGGRYCDCSTSNHPTKHYAGLYCQYEATTYCSEAKRYFCVNGGTCVPQGTGAFSCACPEGWTGPSCEFESHDRDHHYENCTLTCYNGGECRKGAKDMSAILGLGPELSHLADEAAHSENFEHCVCRDRFTGLKCEHEYEQCGNGEHICLHGSKCVPPRNELHPIWTCECEEAFREDHMYAGKFCQHHHTSTCTTDDAQNGVYLGYKSLAFCVNDGVCIEIVENGESRPGCRCPEGYIGAHCELLDTQLHQDGPPLKIDNTGSAALIFFLLVLSILIVVLTGVIILRYRRGREWNVETEHLNQEVNESAVMEEVDFDDEDLGAMEDVELL